MLVPMSFVAPSRKRTLHPTNFLTNSTGRHKAHVRLYECGPGVCCMQQLPLSLCLSLLHSVLPAELAPLYACISVRSCVGWLENRKAFRNVYWRQYSSLLICLALSAKKYASVSVSVPNPVSVHSHFAEGFEAERQQKSKQINTKQKQ